MKVVFMGTPEFSVPTLQMLIDEGHEIVGVVTQPDRPKGRGKKEVISPVKELALKYDLTVFQPNRVKENEEFLSDIKALKPDVMIVVAYGQILPESILEIPPLGCINIHGSLLPHYRGAAPIQWCIINGEEETGVTIMYMNKGMDTGDMLLTTTMPVEKNDTYQTLHDKMKIVGAETLKLAMPQIIDGGKGRVAQNDEEATYAPPIQKALGEIDWAKNSKNIDCLVRGVNPWPGAYTFYEGQVFKVWSADIISDELIVSQYDKVLAGTICLVDKNGMLVKTGDGIMLVSEIQAPNKKRMLVSEYIKGNTIKADVVLGK
ncbi:MAG: methionyl-tRNA formyltransferase [Cellulosilyticaceae bacterium]